MNVTTEDEAQQQGVAWAVSVRQALEREGRPAAGGWPGTMSQARTLAARAAKRATAAERERLARDLYAAAKAHWLDHREPATS